MERIVQLDHGGPYIFKQSDNQLQHALCGNEDKD